MSGIGKVGFYNLGGKIQVTKTTYEILQDEFVLEQRGEISVKGIGKMTTYFLCGHKNHLSSHPI